MNPEADPPLKNDPPQGSNLKPRRPWAAGLLSLAGLGLGQIYNGQVKKALAFHLLVWLVLSVYLTIDSWSTFKGLILLLVLYALLRLASLADALLVARKRTGYYLKKYNRWYVYLALTCFLALVVNPALQIIIDTRITVLKIASQGMSPTLLAGDHFLGSRTHYDRQGIKRGDVVVFLDPRQPVRQLKRVIGLPGEQVEIIDKNVYINGQPIKEGYKVQADQTTLPRSARRDNFGPVSLPEGKYFLLGDNRDQSYDSRFFGPVDRSGILAKALYVYLSLSPDGSGVRWGRVGARIE